MHTNNSSLTPPHTQPPATQPLIDLSTLPPSQTSSPPKPLFDVLPDNELVLQIDNSSLEHFTVCPKSADYALVRRRVLPSSAAMSFGTAIHAALEHRYKTLGASHITSEVEQDMLEILTRHFDENPVHPDEWRNLAQAHAGIKKYNKTYPSEHVKILSVETPFSLPLGTLPIDTTIPRLSSLVSPSDPNIAHLNPHNFCSLIHVFWTGRIDLLFTAASKTWVRDIKTTSILGPTFWRQFELSAQMFGYVWAAEQLLSTPVSGLELDALASRKPTKTGVQFEPIRQIFPYRRDQINTFPDNTLTVVADFISHLLRDNFPRYHTWCVNKYGTCPYHDVCTLPPTSRPHMLHSDRYTNNNWSPLD